MTNLLVLLTVAISSSSECSQNTSFFFVERDFIIVTGNPDRIIEMCHEFYDVVYPTWRQNGVGWMNELELKIFNQWRCGFFIYDEQAAQTFLRLKDKYKIKQVRCYNE